MDAIAGIVQERRTSLMENSDADDKLKKQKQSLIKKLQEKF